MQTSVEVSRGRLCCIDARPIRGSTAFSSKLRRLFHRQDTQTYPSREHWRDRISNLQSHTIICTSEYCLVRKTLETHGFTKGDRSVLLVMGEAPSRNVGATCGEGWRGPIPPHAAIDIVVTVVSLVAIELKLRR